MNTLLLKKLVQQVLKMQELQEYLEQMELKLDISSHCRSKIPMDLASVGLVVGVWSGNIHVHHCYCSDLHLVAFQLQAD